MAGLFPLPTDSYSMAGLTKINGRVNDGGMRPYTHDPQYLHAIVGGGAIDSLSAVLDSVLSQVTTSEAGPPLEGDTVTSETNLPPGLGLADFADMVTDVTGALGPDDDWLGDIVIEPLAVNNDHATVYGALPDLRGNIPARGRRLKGAFGRGGAQAQRHPLMTFVAGRHTDVVDDVAAEGDLLTVNSDTKWDRLPRAANRGEILKAEAGGANKNPTWGLGVYRGNPVVLDPGTDAADNNSWDRTSDYDPNFGLTLRVVCRMKEVGASLYQYRRDLFFDCAGILKSVGQEIRTVVIA